MNPSISEHSMFQNMIGRSILPIFAKSKDLQFAFVNQAMAQWLGASDPSEATGKTDLDYPTCFDAQSTDKIEKSIIETGIPAEDLVEMQDLLDGSKAWTSSFKYPLYGDDGEIIGIWGIIRDITESKQDKEKLDEVLVRYQQLGEQNRTFNWEVDELGLYTFADSFVEKVLDYRADELVGRMHFYDLCPEKDRDAFKNAALDVFRRKERFQNLENIAQTKDGRMVWLSTSGIPLLRDDGTLKGYHGNDIDITLQKDRENQIMYLSYHDHLTGLYNRRFYEEELNRLDTASSLPISIIMGDVNGMKLVNDSFGHAMGDELLIKVAEVIRKGCRNDDIIARLGGDEFVILLPNTSAHEAESILKRITDLSSQEKVCNLDLSISFGSETKTNRDEYIQDIVKNAEDQMYRNKYRGSAAIRSKAIDLTLSTLYDISSMEQLHSVRVSELCVEIASEMYHDDLLIEQIRLAGLMHDIGKTEIDVDILNKPIALDTDEWEEIKRHPEIGYRILRTSRQFSEIADFVLEHHERWDGKGYPRGLEGEGISLQARIIAVADSYDAMMMNKPYSRTLSGQEAVEEMRRCSGTQFDPSVVRVLMSILQDKAASGM